jgi:enoyl-CoA hydratase/carnithine racemase
MLGTRAALRICIDGSPLPQAEALELGMVDELVASDRLLDRAHEVAARLGRRPKAGIAGVKRAVYLGGSQPLAAGLRLERAEFMAALGTEESDRAMAAYVDQLERDGELPAYDPETMERVRDSGRFG